MPITGVEVDHYMRVKHASFKPTPGVNEITGDNGAGKTSLLQAIATMGGKRNIAWKPINSGAKEAKIIIDIDGVGEVPIRMIRRMFTNEDGTTGETMTVEGPGGSRFSKPQSLMDSIVTEFSFDPLSMLDMDQKSFLNVLKRFVPDYDFEGNDVARKTAFDDRTDVNRDLKNLKSQVAGFSITADTPDEEINIDALTADLEAVGTHNTDVETRKANRARVADEAVRLRAEAASLEQQAVDYVRLADQARVKATEAVTKADDNDKRLKDAGPLPEPKDASDIRAQIERANIVNATVRDKKRMNGLITQAEAKEAESKALSKKIEDIDAAKANSIKTANLPVDGLDIDADGVVMFNGEPLSQASQAQKIRVSVALAAAMSPKLKVAIIKDGSLLDKKSWALMEAYAAEHGLQIFVETVSSDRPTAIVIEDGRMVESEAMKVAAE